jgi:2-methylisocitrate lyase-like PEP mutase family enzyme
MSTQTQRADRFLALHRQARPLLLPNPWDPGTARILASLGFDALATTSSGHAATSGRLDGSVTREEAIGHAAAIVAATELPVSADLENCFADDPDGVAQTIRLALAAGLRAARSRTTRVATRRRSTSFRVPLSASSPPPRSRTAARSTWC